MPFSNLKLGLAFCSIFCFGIKLFAQVPHITSFAPATAHIGSPVVITGTNFSPVAANNIVYFGAVKATVTLATPTAITVTVPSGAAYKPITVTTGGLTAYSRASFTTAFAGADTLSSQATFETPVRYKHPLRAIYMAAADFDGDGKVDLLVPSADDGSVTSTDCSIFRNTSVPGTISFATRKSLTTIRSPRDIVTGDFDGDGKLDIAIYNVNELSSISIFKNTSTLGKIAFAHKTDLTKIYASGDGIAVEDVNGDGKPDIVATGNQISVYKNTSAGDSISFDAPEGYSVPGSLCVGILLRDFDGDGKPDIAVTGYKDTSAMIYLFTLPKHKKL